MDRERKWNERLPHKNAARESSLGPLGGGTDSVLLCGNEADCLMSVDRGAAGHGRQCRGRQFGDGGRADSTLATFRSRQLRSLQSSVHHVARGARRICARRNYSTWV